MAIKFKLPSFKFFSTMDAKSRIFLIFAAVVGIFLVIFLGSRYLSQSVSTTGASSVAAAPPGLQSVPGGQLSPEYYRALMQANVQAAQQAQITGGSAVPTLVNIPGAQQEGFSQQTSCTVLCPSDDKINVADTIAELVKAGKLPQKDADMLLALAKNNVPVDEYAAALNDLVKAGKLTPEQARQLLEQYKKQHQNALTNESAAAMDGLIKAGQLPLDVANQLLALQKSGIKPVDYAAELNRLAAEGKITPQIAAALLSQYTQQQAREATKQGIFGLKQLAKAGAITQDVANQLAEMQNKNVPVDQYAAALDRLVAEGKLTPAEAAKLLAEYKAKRNLLGPADALASLIQQAEIACQNDLNLQKKLSGSQSSTSIPITCQKLNELKAAAQRLARLQGNNASVTEYANELKRAVQAGLLSPETAANLMQQYAAMTAPLISTAPIAETSIPRTAEFAKLQQAVQAAQPAGAAPSAPGQAAQFLAAAAQAQQQALEDRQQKIQQIQAAMSNQAQSLLAAWQPPKMAHQAGSPPTAAAKSASLLERDGLRRQAGGKDEEDATAKPLIKAGTILFGVLDTAVDSDYPDTPVLVTIVQGPYKGAKLLGKLALAQGQDKVSLNFNLMDREDWLKTKNVTAFAIDPDTARTVLASHVNYHYLMRYGALFASSFLTGFASGIQNAGTSTTGIFGTSTTHPELSFGKNVAVALGQVGTAFTSAVQSNVNRPTTVKVDAGVGVGVLFMADVTS